MQIVKKLLITQIASCIGRKYDQKQTLVGLGLNKLRSSRVVDNNPEMYGMINKVKHLLKVEEIR